MNLRKSALSLGLLLALAGTVGCAAETYDPDWNANDVIAGGKADGLLDALPALVIGGESISGDVGGERAELYVLALRRTDSVEITMTVDSGDLNPHLSLFVGTSSYVSSDDWSREGNTLRKTYTVEEDSSYLVAARAYRGEGSGEYTLSVTCQGGPCAGDFPEPGTELDLSDVEDCLGQARACAFDDLPRWNGRVGAVRAQQIFTSCLETVALTDGTSCEFACNWELDDGDGWEHAQPYCDAVVGALPFYADASEACIQQFDYCWDNCEEVGSWNNSSYSDGFGETTEATCFAGGLNGNCDIYARESEACGGDIIPDGAADCIAMCHSSSGAFTDDTSDLCDECYDEELCAVEFEAWEGDCGPLSASTAECYRDKTDDVWVCEDELEEAIDAL